MSVSPFRYRPEEPGYANFKELLPLWENLALNPSYADPACCAPAWNLAYHDVFDQDKPLLYAAGAGSLLLFTVHTFPEGHVWLAPVENSWNFGRPLLGRNAVDLFASTMAEWEKTGARHIFISGINPQLPEAQYLLAVFAKSHNFYRHERSIQAAASLSGGFEGWLSRRSANHRAKLRKAAKKAARAGMVFERHRPASSAEAALVYERMIAVERLSWKGLGDCGMDHAGSREFYAALIARQAALGNALVIFARMNDKDIGFIYGGLCGGIYRGQQFSFENSLRAFSPGNLMQMEKIAWLCELGIARYDMGPVTGPRMEYKRHWTEQFREMESWIMRKKD